MGLDGGGGYREGKRKIRREGGIQGATKVGSEEIGEER